MLATIRAHEKGVLAGVILLALSTLVYAAVTTQWVIGSAGPTAVLTPNSIGSNGYTAASSVISNAISGQTTGAGYTRCEFEAVLAFPASPSANAAVLLWLQLSPDGTNYADTPTSAVTTTPAHVAIPITQGQTGTRQTVVIECPPGSFKVTAQLNGTGQTTNASGNSITVKQYTTQGNP